MLWQFSLHPPKSHMKFISQGTDQGTLTFCLNCLKASGIFSRPATFDIRRWAELQRGASQMSSFPFKGLTSSHFSALCVYVFRLLSISPGPLPVPRAAPRSLGAGLSLCHLLVLMLWDLIVPSVSGAGVWVWACACLLSPSAPSGTGPALPPSAATIHMWTLDPYEFILSPWKVALELRCALSKIHTRFQRLTMKNRMYNKYLNEIFYYMLKW